MLRVMNPALPHKTRAGINWVHDPRYGSAKIALGAAAVKQNPCTPGYFGIQNGQRMLDMLEAKIPGVVADLRKDYTGQDLRTTVLRRGAYCVPPEQYEHGKNELNRFQKPVWSPLYEAITTQQQITYDFIQELQERSLKIEFRGECGVYCRWNYNEPEMIYIGSAKNFAERSHSNASHHMWSVFATADIATARNIETLLHNWLHTIGRSVRTRGRGLFVIPGCNAKDVVETYINQTYGRIFHRIGTGIG